jgi:hypothetical protein
VIVTAAAYRDPPTQGYPQSEESEHPKFAAEQVPAEVQRPILRSALTGKMPVRGVQKPRRALKRSHEKNGPHFSELHSLTSGEALRFRCWLNSDND